MKRLRNILGIICTVLLTVHLSFGQVSDAALTTQSNVIRDETVAGANTKTRIAAMYQAIIDSKVSLIKFPAPATIGTSLQQLRVVSGGGSLEWYTPAGAAVWGSITGTLTDQTDLINALNLKAPLASPTFTGTVSGITSTMVGLGNVDNTSDANKPVSTATQTALNLKANLASPTLTGVPLAPTAAPGTNTAQIATMAALQAAISAASIPDGDKGDVTVSGTGAVWTVDNLAITNAKINDVAVGKITGTLPVTSGGTGATSFTSGVLLKGNGTSALSAANPYLDYLKPSELLPSSAFISDNFNRADGSPGANWTNTGAATFTIASNKLHVVGGSSLTLSDYLTWNAYGNSNLESWVATYKITPGTISATSFGHVLNIVSNATAVISFQIRIDLTTANQGKIFFYRQGITTALSGINSNGLAITAGDDLRVTVRFEKTTYKVLLFNATTGLSNYNQYDVTTAYGTNQAGAPNSYRFAFGAPGGTHDIDDFSVISKDPLGYTIGVFGDSQAKYNADDLNTAWPGILKDQYNVSVITHSGSGSKIEELNTTEFIAETPTIVIINALVNNVQAGDATGTIATKLATCVSAFTGAGYVLGTTLFINLVTPGSYSNVANTPTVNANIISTYGASGAVIDTYTSMTNGGTNLRWTIDGIHYTAGGHKIVAGIIATKLGLDNARQKTGPSFPSYYNQMNGYMMIGDNIYKSQTPDYQLTVKTVSSAPQLKISSVTADDGLYLGNNGTSSYITQSMAYDGATNYVAKATTVGGIFMNAGTIGFGVLTGQTIGSNTAGVLTKMSLSPTALTMSSAVGIILGAGSTTVAPLKFTSGTNKTTAAAGEMEYNGTDLFFTAVGTNRLTVMSGYFGQTTLVSGTKAVTVNGVGTGSFCVVTMVTPSGSSLSAGGYQCVCTSNTITIQANVSAGTINTADGSVLNYMVKP